MTRGEAAVLGAVLIGGGIGWLFLIGLPGGVNQAIGAGLVLLGVAFLLRAINPKG